MPPGAVKGVVAMLGLKNAFIYGFSRLLQAASGDRFYIIRYHLIAQPVLVHQPIELRDAGGFQVRPVLPDDPIVASFPRPAHVVHKRFADGAVCFVAHSGERLVGFLWLKRERYEEDEVRCTFIPDPVHLAAWDFDLHIEPAYRMSRAFARLWQEAHEYLKGEELMWTFS